MTTDPPPTADPLLTCPYPGLWPFSSDEADVFFGRDAQVDQLLGRLARQRFLAVVGKSGCGKSSMVAAGLIPAMKTGLMGAAAGARWAVATMRPGDRPFRRLIDALLCKEVLGPVWSGLDHPAALLHAALQRGPLGLTEVLRETPLTGGRKLLLLVDQFEELFKYRYEGEGQREEANAFVALLLATVREPDRPVYIVLTMRSDFLGMCDVFDGLPEALNDSQFLTPRLNRDQLGEAIEKPAQVFGGRVEPAVVNRLLNDMEPGPDQLPLMQHTLMRMWNQACDRACACAASSEATGDPTASGDSVVVTFEDYEKLGGFDKSLSKHADEIYENLHGKKQAITEVLFRCLCERRIEADTRRPARLGAVASVAAAVLHARGVSVDEDEVKDVVDVFRGPDVQFIMPRLKEELKPETLLDISHECVIRHWEKLQESWLVSEAEKANYYRHIVQMARYWKTDKAELLKGADLDEALIWWMHNNPNADWAMLYDGERAPENMTLVEQFLELGKEEVEKQRTFRQDSEVEPHEKVSLSNIAAWEKAFMNLHDFWVVLPKFLGHRKDFFDTMMFNIKEKATRYLFFLDSNIEVIYLKNWFTN